VLIKSAHDIVDEALAEIGQSLTNRGVTLDDLIERGRVIREALVAEEYGLSDPPS